MRLQSLVSLIQAGGPGSGCHGDNCGRPGGAHSEGSATVHNAIEEWAGLDQNSKPLNSIMEKIQGGDSTSPEAIALLKMAKQAQDDLAALGSYAIPLYRVELNTGSLRQDSMLRSYALTEEAAKKYLAGYEESMGHKLQEATVTKKMITRSHVVAYYRQSDNFIPEEKEVLVSRKPFTIPKDI